MFGTGKSCGEWTLVLSAFFVFDKLGTHISIRSLMSLCIIMLKGCETGWDISCSVRSLLYLKKNIFKKSNILHLCGFTFFISVKEESLPDYISLPPATLKTSATKLGRNGSETTTSPVTCVALRSTYLLNICLVYLSDIHENAWRGCSADVGPAECETNALT